MSDFPGINTDLQPLQAPRWMQPLLEDPDPSLLPPLAPSTDKAAAVLMLLKGTKHPHTADEPPSDTGLVVTHRSPRMRSHAGQMAFPGGRVDPEDISVVDAALREAWEETGLDRRSVTPVASWRPSRVAVNHHPIHPILAYWDHPHELYPASEDEVNDVFVADIDELVDPQTRISVGFRDYVGPAFRVSGYLIWGYTGMLIHGMFRAAGWEKPWEEDRVLDLAEELRASRNNERHSGL